MAEKRKRKSLFCGHCNSFVSHPTFYRHKAKFYDMSKDVWVRESASESDSEFEMDTAVNEDTLVEVRADANGNLMSEIFSVLCKCCSLLQSPLILQLVKLRHILVNTRIVKYN